eukprot:TRINITY_DN19951_c0_g1_i2.p1 TRINITY_DN19951_c0_g1~~TRINITY_DN19951_c0_g1_i2.p1  ORF type:complete len:323 (-),score=27.87 TRINITY_DN19951_c0_g1_i2:51-1019(-)
MSEQEEKKVVDRWGFLQDKEEDEEVRQKYADEENKKLLKWTTVLKSWNDFRTTKINELNELLREGLPDGVRGFVWSSLAEIETQKINQPNLYQELIVRGTEYERPIFADSHRSFPNHVFFAKGVNGQQNLIHVLTAYAVLDPEIGYASGMSFIASILLMYMPEEDAFWAFRHILQAKGMRAMFAAGRPLLSQNLFQLKYLIHRFLPRIAEHLEAQQISAEHFAARWFCALFTTDVSFETTLRVWDLFLLQGPDIMFSVALAILKIRKDEILRLEFEDLMMELHRIAQNIPAQQIIDVALSLGVSAHHIEEAAQMYLKASQNS